jgi:hypothetical protein
MTQMVKRPPPPPPRSSLHVRTNGSQSHDIGKVDGLNMDPENKLLGTLSTDLSTFDRAEGAVGTGAAQPINRLT